MVYYNADKKTVEERSCCSRRERLVCVPRTPPTPPPPKSCRRINTLMTCKKSRGRCWRAANESEWIFSLVEEMRLSVLIGSYPSPVCEPWVGSS